ncbi:MULTISPECIES: ROK family transcriptional regulator [Actinoallomurus]|uniref:ROK family transcriptional regulator n=1 Tax=Actinoallomurus TaxID=667113 RepID=UPI0020903DFD|nr:MULTISPECIES: ROK family transcriptional regulator [Actinoallomurus]MCO5966815.1 ROK family transcriptional regulator [Actinoallomurus soli]MCO5992363.1 ROK family transcriptional regulator [Actinoallomurus rhizosphaericola]
MPSRPGTPRLLRELNDRSALDLLVSSGPLTRAQIGQNTGLSKVTASQLLSRLQERGLVAVVGEQAGGRGPNAALYAVVPSSAYVAGLEVGPNRVTAGIADITGKTVAEVTVDPNGADDPVSVIHDAVVRACRSARIALGRLHALVVGTPGVVDPRTGDVQFIFDMPHWHAGILEALRRDLKLEVTIENDVNLAALAERADGAARDVGDFALLWAARGIGLAVMLGGRLHRGVSGGAGEIGYLPVPGMPLPEQDTESVTWGMKALGGGLGALVGADAIRELAGRYGFAAPTATECVRTAAEAGEDGDPFMRELAARLAYGVASVTIVLDPGLVVLAGDVGRAGGERLAGLVEEAVGRICPTRPRVVLTEVEGNPVLRGALFAAVDRARDDVFSASAG